MRVLTNNVDYAVRALVLLADNRGSYVSARGISDKAGIPYQFLRRIMRELIKASYVTSREGGRGGFRINKKARSIAVADIIVAFKGDIRFSRCIFKQRLCNNHRGCLLRRELARIEKIMVKEFRGVTIDKLSVKLDRNKGG